jgi:hypothetical protein
MVRQSILNTLMPRGKGGRAKFRSDSIDFYLHKMDGLSDDDLDLIYKHAEEILDKLDQIFKDVKGTDKKPSKYHHFVKRAWELSMPRCWPIFLLTAHALNIKRDRDGLDAS